MFLAVAESHAPVWRSNSPGAHSVTIPSATGVLLRSEVPPHWFQSPALMTGFCRAVELPAADLGCSAADLSVAGFSAGFFSVGFSFAGLLVGCSSAGFSAG